MACAARPRRMSIPVYTGLRCVFTSATRLPSSVFSDRSSVWGRLESRQTGAQDSFGTMSACRTRGRACRASSDWSSYLDFAFWGEFLGECYRILAGSFTALDQMSHSEIEEEGEIPY